MTASIDLPRKERNNKAEWVLHSFIQTTMYLNFQLYVHRQLPKVLHSPAGVLGFLLKADIGLVRLSRFGEGFDLFISIPLWTCYARQAGQAIEDAKSL